MIYRLFAQILYRVKIKLYLKGFKNVGYNISLKFPLKIEGKNNVEIGDNTSIGTYVHIWGNGGVRIGKDVLIAAHCCITSLTHDYSMKPVRLGKIVSKTVIIEDDVWLGYNVIVLPGITIGKGSIVAAGSVVTKDIPPYSIAVGNPAVVIKKRIISNVQ